MNPKFPIPGVELGELTSNMDFEQTALSMPEGMTKCLPNPDHLRAVTMRGHDGSFHSHDVNTARRHNVFHDLRKHVGSAAVKCDMYGNQGEFKVDAQGNHNGMVFNLNRFTYMLQTGYIDKQLGGLVQKAFTSMPSERSSGYTKPTPPQEDSVEIHTSWLQTIARRWTPEGSVLVRNDDIMYQDGVLIHGPANGTFGKNKFFEMQVDFSHQFVGGLRHSWWWMPVKPNTAYDANKRNGTEVDGYEHEVTNHAEFSDTCFMKSLGGDIIGNTVNEIPYDGIDPERALGHRAGAIHTPGVNEGIQTFALMWEESGENSRIRWFRNGKEVVRDSALSPVDILMYMILSREGKVDHGLSGENIYDYLDRIAEDYVLTKYIRCWNVVNPYGMKSIYKDTAEAFTSQKGALKSGGQSVGTRIADHPREAPPMDTVYPDGLQGSIDRLSDVIEKATNTAFNK